MLYIAASPDSIFIDVTLLIPDFFAICCASSGRIFISFVLLMNMPLSVTFIASDVSALAPPEIITVTFSFSTMTSARAVSFFFCSALVFCSPLCTAGSTVLVFWSRTSLSAEPENPLPDAPPPPDEPREAFLGSGSIGSGSSVVSPRYEVSELTAMADAGELIGAVPGSSGSVLLGSGAGLQFPDEHPYSQTVEDFEYEQVPSEHVPGESYLIMVIPTQ